MLTQSLSHVLDASSKLRRRYDRLCEYKKPGLVRTRLRRRVFAEIFQMLMLKKRQFHYGRDITKRELKMNRYGNFLAKRINPSEIA